jgi:site-specific DNA recombinase
MDVVIYTRVSTDDQKENGYSLQDQERRLREYSKKNNKTVIAHYQDDHSAKNFNRPQFQKFLTDLKEKHIKPKQLICVRWDRFSRDVLLSLQMINTLKSYGIELKFLDNDYDTSQPESLLATIIHMAIPQVENERRALNTIQGMRQALREGRWVWRAPRGYINDKQTKSTLVSDEAHYVIKAFEEVAIGLKSVDSIRKELNRKGFKCSKQGFLNILTNIFYTGTILIHQRGDEEQELVKGIHEPLISEETFNRVQTILSGRSRKQPKLGKINELFPLRGHLNCHICGSILTASSSRGRNSNYSYYHCQRGCKVRFNSEVANSCFVGYLDSIIVNPEVVELYSAILKDTFEKNEGSKEQESQKIEAEINSKKLSLKKADDKLLNGEIASEDYRRIVEGIKTGITNLELTKSDLMQIETNLERHFKYGASLITHLSYYYTNAPIEVKHRLIGSIFPEKLVYSDDSYRTTRTNSLISLMCSDSIGYTGTKSEKATLSNGLSTLAPPVGLEPTTL